MKLMETVTRFYYFEMAVSELRSMNQARHYPNITYNSLLYLNIIAYVPNCTASYLADLLNISKSAVTIKINELIKQGFVEKTQSKKDKRIKYLSLRGDIAKEFRQYDAFLYNTLEKIEKGYSESDLEIFSGILLDIGKSFRAEVKQK